MLNWGPKKNATFIVVMTILLFVPCRTPAQTDIPPNLQAAIFLKVLNYDQNLAAKSGDKISIILVTDKRTLPQTKTLISGFGIITKQKIQGKSIEIKNIVFNNVDQLATEISAAKGNILFLAAGSEDQTVGAVISLADKHKYPTLGGEASFVKRGVAVGLTVENGKPKILVNLPASQNQGMKLSSKVLRLAQVIK